MTEQCSDEDLVPLSPVVTFCVLKYRLISGKPEQTLGSFDGVSGTILLSIITSLLQKRFFADSSFDTSNLNRIIAVQVSGDENYYFVTKVLVLFHLHVDSSQMEELAIVQYFDAARLVMQSAGLSTAFV